MATPRSHLQRHCLRLLRPSRVPRLLPRPRPLDRPHRLKPRCARRSAYSLHLRQGLLARRPLPRHPRRHLARRLCSDRPPRRDFHLLHHARLRLRGRTGCRRSRPPLTRRRRLRARLKAPDPLPQLPVRLVLLRRLFLLRLLLLQSLNDLRRLPRRKRAYWGSR